MTASRSGYNVPKNSGADLPARDCEVAIMRQGASAPIDVGSTGSLGTALLCVAALIVISFTATATAVMKDDFLLVPQFAGQRKSNLALCQDSTGVMLLQWTEAYPPPTRSYFRRFSNVGDPRGPLFEVSGGMIAQGYKVLGSWPALHPGGKLLALHSVRKDTVFATGDTSIIHRGYFQTFDTLGNALAPPMLLTDSLPSALRPYGIWPEGVTTDPDGTINVLYWDWNATSITGDLQLARYDTLGNSLGPWQKVNDCAWNCNYAQAERMVTNGRGRVLIVWQALSPDQSIIVPWFRVFDNGVPVTPTTAFTCLGPTPNCSEGYIESCVRGDSPFGAVRRDGSFAVTFGLCAAIENDSGGSITAWLFDADAQLIDSAGILEDFATHTVRLNPQIAIDAESSYVVSWAGLPWYPRADLFLQRIDLQGHKLGHTYRVNTPIGGVWDLNQFGTATYEGHITSMWFDGRDYPPYGRDIYCQVIPADDVGARVVGDVNYDGFITSGDIIYLVNYIFKSGDPPYGFADGGDTNGSCAANSADIIYLVNFVFKSGLAPVEPCSQ